MSNGNWLALLLACLVGVAGLLLAASSQQGTGYWLGFVLFVAAVLYSALVIKRTFDRIDRHRR